MTDPTAGAITAILSPLAMTVGFIMWGESWTCSAYALNQFKCTLAGLVFLAVSLSLSFSRSRSRSTSVSLFSTTSSSVSSSEQAMIMLSSLLGIVIGDNAWLLALQRIGAKRVIVIDTLKPFLAAVMANLFLGEALTISMVFGIMFSSVGVLLVSLEKQTNHEEVDEQNNEIQMDNEFRNFMHEKGVDGSGASRDKDKIDSREQYLRTSSLDEQYLKKELQRKEQANLLTGYGFAALNVFLDGIGSVLTKQFGTSLNTWEINFLRFGFAAIVMAVLAGIVYFIKHILWAQPVSHYEYQFDNDLISTHHPRNGYQDGTTLTPFELELANFQSMKAVTPTQHNVWYIFPRYSDMKREQWLKVVVGVMFVTFLCPALANYALFQLPLGLCLTLTSLGPIYSVPLAYILSGEKTTIQGVVGSFVAVAGVVILVY